MHLLWLDVKSVKGRKEGKDEEINREAIRPVKMGWRSESPRGEEKKWSPKVWGLVQSWRVAWVRASKREEKNRENKRKYTVKKKAVSEKRKKKWVYFSQVVSLSVVISI